MPGLIDGRFVTGLVRGYQFLLPQDRGPCLVWAYQDVFQRVLTHYSSVQKWSWCWNSEREVWDLTPTCVSASKSLHKVEFSGSLRSWSQFSHSKGSGLDLWLHPQNSWRSVRWWSSERWSDQPLVTQIALGRARICSEFSDSAKSKNYKHKK